MESMTEIKDLGLHEYELECNEWEIAQQLVAVLKVCQIFVNFGLDALTDDHLPCWRLFFLIMHKLTLD